MRRETLQAENPSPTTLGEGCAIMTFDDKEFEKWVDTQPFHWFKGWTCAKCGQTLGLRKPLDAECGGKMPALSGT